jgi:hypothetical protein
MDASTISDASSFASHFISFFLRICSIFMVALISFAFTSVLVDEIIICLKYPFIRAIDDFVCSPSEQTVEMVQ